MKKIISYTKSSYNIVKSNPWLIVPAILLSGAGNYTRETAEAEAANYSQLGGSERITSAMTQIANMISQTNLFTWIVFFLAVVLFVFAVTALAYIAYAWVSGAVIYGIQKARSGETVHLSTISGHAIVHGRQLVVLQIKLTIRTLIVIAASLSSGLVISGISGLFNAIGISGFMSFLLVAVSSLVILIATTYFLVLIALTTPVAIRLVVIKGMSSRQAIKKGMSIAKHFSLSCLGLALGNFTITIFALITFGVLAAFVPTFFLSTLLLGAVSTVVFATLRVITEANWNQHFEHLVKMEEKLTHVKI
jgi:hypothetical protein